MPTYAYVAKDKAGKIHRGRAEANNEKMLTKKLQDSGYWVTQVTDENAAGKSKKKNPLMAFKKVKLNHLSIFCRQFATMINAGVSLVRCDVGFGDSNRKPAFERNHHRRAEPRRGGRNLIARDDAPLEHFQQLVYRSGARR